MYNKINLLIVEDEAIIAENLRLTLDDLGFHTANVCYNYINAVETVENEHFDLALLDINLGSHAEKSGLDVATLIQKKYPEMPIIFLTAYNDRETIMQAAALKPAGYITKPASPATLFANIQIALENFAQNRQLSEVDSQPEIPDFFFVKTGKKVQRVEWNSVVKIEHIKNYAKVITPDNPTGFLLRGSLQTVVDQLVPVSTKNLLVKVNRALYVHVREIKSFDDSFVYIFNEKVEHTGNFKDEVKRAMQHCKC